MAKVKVKLPDSLKDKDVKGMFDKLSGVASADFEIVYPKYLKVVSLLDKVVAIFKILCEFVPENYRNDFNNACKKYVLKTNLNLDNKTQQQQDEFHQDYLTFKKCNLVTYSIQICNELQPYKNELSGVNYIINSPTEMRIFPFSKLDLRNLMVDSEQRIRSIFATALEKLFTFGHEVYKIITSPDIDLDELVDMLSKSMESLEKQPRLSRCKMAFAKLKKSIGMLKENFGNYYKDYLQTGNSAIIMEHFVLDVSKDTKASPELAMQFKTIGNYYKEMSAHNGTSNDPRFKKLYSALDYNFSVLDKHTAGSKEKTELDNEDVEKNSKNL